MNKRLFLNDEFYISRLADIFTAFGALCRGFPDVKVDAPTPVYSEIFKQIFEMVLKVLGGLSDKPLIRKAVRYSKHM
jgi:hypothetical protein